jgi:putative peptidoglycan lipid II flippase
MIVSAAYLGSRVTGWIRIAAISSTFGASRDLDAFYAAFRIPDLIFQLVAAGALGSALIPLLSALITTGQENRAWRIASTVTNAMLVGLAILGLLAFVFAPTVVAMAAPGFDDSQVRQAADLARIMLLSPIFLALGSVATSVLNAEKRFLAASLAPVFYNLAIIGGAIFLAPAIGVVGLAIAVVAGSVLHFLVQVPSLRRIGMHYRPGLDWRDREAAETFALLVPRALGLGTSQLALVVATGLASSLAVGSITDFTVAFTVLQIPIGILSVPIGIVILPELSRHLARDAMPEFVGLLSRSLGVLAYLILPITTIGMVLRRPTIELLFEYGKFDASAVSSAADTLLFLMAGLFAESMIALLARAFYAGRDTRTPVVAAVAAVVLTICTSLALVGPFGLPGIAIAFASGASLEATVLFIAAQARYSSLIARPLLASFVKALVAAIAGSAVAMVAFVTAEGLTGGSAKAVLALDMLVAVSTGGTAYVAAGAILRIREQQFLFARCWQLLHHLAARASRA